LILVYGDDSEDEKNQRVVAVAGVVGTIPAWRALEREWIVRTDGIPFHANSCESDQGPYKDFPHAENKALYKDLVMIMAQSHIHGIGVAIDLIAGNQIFPNTEDISYYKAFLRVIQIMTDCAMENREIADYTFDMRMDTQHNLALLYGAVRENERDWTSYLADEFHFAYSRNQPRLQVADLMAYEAFKALDNKVGPVKRPERKSLEALVATKRFKVEAYSAEWFTDLKKNYGDLEKKVGFNGNDYRNWLAERKRMHNVSNLILFMDWIARRDKCKIT
jgi:hypothetical protein